MSYNVVNRSNYTDFWSSTDQSGYHEPLWGLSETVPGQNITPKEIVSRYINGQALPQMAGVYTDNNMLPDNFERMDKVQRAELAHKMLAIIADRQRRMQERAARARPATDAEPEPQSQTPLKEAPAGNNPPSGGQGG